MRQRTAIWVSTLVTPSWRCARLVAIATWSCDLTVPLNVTTPLLVVTEMSESFRPESAAIAAFTLPVVIVSLTAPVAFPAGPGAIVGLAALGDGEVVLGGLAAEVPELL